MDIGGINMPDKGLVLIKKQTATSVTNFTVNNCFSGDYSLYRLILDQSSNATGNARLRLTSGGTPRTSNYTYQYWNADGTTENGGRSSSSYDGIDFQVTKSDGSKNLSMLEILNPYSATQPTSTCNRKIDRTSIAMTTWVQGTTDETSYDGVYIFDSTGTFSTATLYVYGYNKS
jgi:hypothetical protein